MYWNFINFLNLVWGDYYLLWGRMMIRWLKVLLNLLESRSVFKDNVWNEVLNFAFFLSIKLFLGILSNFLVRNRWNLVRVGEWFLLFRGFRFFFLEVIGVMEGRRVNCLVFLFWFYLLCGFLENLGDGCWVFFYVANFLERGFVVNIVSGFVFWN